MPGLSKTKNEEYIMRLLILAAAATLLITGTAMADESDGTSARHHHHYREANASVPNAPVPDGSAPADTLSAHDAYIRNLREAGYNPAGDRDAAGNVRQY
jgi:hypothetical protein